ncbi:MAG: magnesium and cobalt efflux protein CorC [Nitrosomonadales bacterium]|nr:magnesium and cobalt efflux protein CorC [Nitrosomonadales bacterium]
MLNFSLTNQIILLAVLLIVSAFFSISETSLMSINRYRLRHLAKNGNTGAKLATKLLYETDKLLSVILLCNNFSNAAAATLVTIIAVQLYGEQQIIIMTGTLITTFLILIFSEISPKVIAAAHSERLALWCSFLLFPILKILYPIVLFVNVFVLGILKIFNIKINFTQNNLITMDELKSIISDSGQFIPNKNKSLLLNLIDLEKVTIDEIMMPHTNIESINLNQSIEEILEKIENFHHNKILVKKEDNDEIQGVLDINKLFKFYIKENMKIENQKELIELIDPPYFIPSGTPIYKQMQKFQDNQEKIGLIVNEHGEFIGLVTLEDILEEVIGEFNIELPSKSSKIIFDENGWIVDGGISIRELNKKLNINLPHNGPKTLNGLILEFFEDIPEPNTGFKIKGITFEIINAQDKIVKSVKIYSKIKKLKN